MFGAFSKFRIVVCSSQTRIRKRLETGDLSRNGLIFKNVLHVIKAQYCRKVQGDKLLLKHNA